MKYTRLLFLVAVLAVAAMPAMGEAVTALTPWGGWQLCADGIEVPGCSSYVPGTETYMLMIQGDTTLAVAYSYSVNVTLRDASVKTLQGIVQRADNSAGFTIILPLTFGGIVQSSAVTITELAPIATTRIINDADTTKRPNYSTRK